MADSIVTLLQQGDPVAIAVAVAVVLISVLLALQLGKGSSKPFLDPQQWKPLTLNRIDQLTHNTKRFVFSLPDPKMRLGLPTGQHITFMAKDSDGKDVYRCGYAVPGSPGPGTTKKQAKSTCSTTRPLLQLQMPLICCILGLLPGADRLGLGSL
jgi:hypothetical protein